MGLLDQVMQAIDDPNRQASTAQISQVLGMVQQISQQTGTDTRTMHQVVALVGEQVRTSLQAQRVTDGESAVEALVQQGSQPGAEVLQRLMSEQQQQQLAQAIAQKTGLEPDRIVALLPALIPIVMQFLNTGAANDTTTPGNNVLTAFLDADQDGDMDLGDMMGMASRFIK